MIKWKIKESKIIKKEKKMIVLFIKLYLLINYYFYQIFILLEYYLIL